ncbi:MAG: class I SAM-dependent methyltransferase, partial [Oceanisphaera sp.]|nr:class I SAM-dependent methyltransferase [Oceanisphaera sp.]
LPTRPGNHDPDARNTDDVNLRRMSFYDRYLLPRLVQVACSHEHTMRQREKIVPLATGKVLEVGIGTGLNLPYYDAGRVAHLWGLDPSPEMWALAQKNPRNHHLDAEFIEAGGEAIPLDDNSADTVVMTYTLCSIPDTHAALAEIKRVLKPGGSLLYCEHGAAPDASVLRWQNRLNPVWKVFSGGCHLHRPVPALLEQSGFRSNDMQTMYLPGWKPASFNYWGTATY